MIIGVDIRVLGNIVKSGIEEYVENLMPHLIKEGDGIQFKLFFSSHKDILPNYEWLKYPNVKLYKFSYLNNLLFASSRFLNRPFVDKMVGGADVFFFPHFFLSSLSSKCKRVTTFHDLSYVHFPEHLTLKKKIWHGFQMIPEWQAKFSDKIIAVSQSTKNDLVNLYKIDPARIEVIYSGVRVSEVRRTSDIINDVINFKRAKNIPNRFIFFLGKLEPRKNIVNIIKVFNNLKSSWKYADIGLVIAGDKGWMHKHIFKEANVVNNAPIIFTGQLTDEEKFLYYSAANLFVYPSFFEGFGFPPLEAMSCGVPVITSRNSSLPEVVGNAAILVDPYSVEELQFWINKLLTDDKLRSLMSKRGMKQALKFSWQEAAQKTLKVLSSSL